ncbi:unnamed protein product [Chrysoparadoxa australica]
MMRAIPSNTGLEQLDEEDAPTDLVPGVYEGGLKLWECSCDLVAHLLSPPLSLGEPGSALELGCGHGFPGITLLKQGWKVTFADYNSEALRHATMPNIQANVGADLYQNASFYAGDWSEVSGLLKKEEEEGGQLITFDRILTAETLYTTQVTAKVYWMIHRHLSANGEALVASKRYYFGCGGGCMAFRDLCTTGGVLSCETVRVIDTGRDNIREILRVTWA